MQSKQVVSIITAIAFFCSNPAYPLAPTGARETEIIGAFNNKISPAKKTCDELLQKASSLIKCSLKPGETVSAETVDGKYILEIFGFVCDKEISKDLLKGMTLKEIDDFNRRYPPFSGKRYQPFLTVKIYKKEKREPFFYTVVFPTPQGITLLKMKTSKRIQYIESELYKNILKSVQSLKPELIRMQYNRRSFDLLIAYSTFAFFRKYYLTKRSSSCNIPELPSSIYKNPGFKEKLDYDPDTGVLTMNSTFTSENLDELIEMARDAKMRRKIYILFSTSRRSKFKAFLDTLAELRGFSGYENLQGANLERILRERGYAVTFLSAANKLNTRFLENKIDINLEFYKILLDSKGTFTAFIKLLDFLRGKGYSPEEFGLSSLCRFLQEQGYNTAYFTRYYKQYTHFKKHNIDIPERFGEILKEEPDPQKALVKFYDELKVLEGADILTHDDLRGILLLSGYFFSVTKQRTNKTLSTEQNLLGMGYKHLSNQEIINWWETGYIDREKKPLPPKHFAHGKIKAIGLKEKSRVGTEDLIKQSDRYIMISESNPSRPDDPFRGAFLKVYKKSELNFSGDTEFIFPENCKIYQYTPSYGGAIRIKPTVWDMWDLHNGKKVIPVKGRVIKQNIIKAWRTDFKCWVYFVSVSLFPEPGVRKFVSISIPVNKVEGHDVKKEPIVMAIEQDPDLGAAVNVYREDEYNSQDELRGKEIISGIYNENSKSFKSTNLDKLSILNYLLGKNRSLKTGRQIEAEITENRIGVNIDYGLIYIYYSLFEDSGDESSERKDVLRKYKVIRIPYSIMANHGLKVGDKVILKSENHPDYGTYIGLYKKDGLYSAGSRPIQRYFHINGSNIRADFDRMKFVDWIYYEKGVKGRSIAPPKMIESRNTLTSTRGINFISNLKGRHIRIMNPAFCGIRPLYLIKKRPWYGYVVDVFDANKPLKGQDSLVTYVRDEKSKSLIKIEEKELREDIYKKWKKDVEKIAKARARAIGRYDIWETLTSGGYEGAYEAVSIWDHRGSLKDFVRNRIKYRILDQIRIESILTRTQTKHLKKLNETRRRISADEGRRVFSIDELVTESGLSRKQVQELLAIESQRSITTSLDKETMPHLELDAMQIEQTSELTPWKQPENEEMVQYIFELLQGDDFTERERLVMEMYYQARMTMKQIAHELNLSESLISQTHGKIISKLKVKFQGGAQHNRSSLDFRQSKTARDHVRKSHLAPPGISIFGRDALHTEIFQR